jgi:tetratricopeptide (TPR) repeat protein
MTVSRFLKRSVFVLACLAVSLSTASAQVISRATLETSESLFSVLTAVNACGYDQELNTSEPVRAQVRAEAARAAQASEAARTATEALCSFYRDHQQANSSATLAQYVSLALSLGEAPAFSLTVKEAELPPDAGYVLGFVPLLKRYYQSVGLHQIWEQHKAEYDAIVERFHSPISNMLLSTDVYLRIPVNGYAGRRMVILVDPMAAPGQMNSRNYGSNYFLVVSPEKQDLHMDAIRHTYLHFTLDPLVARRSTASMKRLEPLMAYVKTAPMADDFKKDVRLLLAESLIRAVEARTSVSGSTKQAEARRAGLAQSAAEEGFILAPYFQEQLAKFEKDTDSAQDALLDWLFQIDVAVQQKRAGEIVFASTARPEGLQRLAKASLLDEAGRRFAAGDIRRARQLAEQALEDKQEDAGRALFILAQVATQDKEMERAQEYFERATGNTRDANVLIWAHIYLGRICDLKAERESAVKHYQQALAVASIDAAARSAAQSGIDRPYEPPRARQQGQQQE